MNENAMGVRLDDRQHAYDLTVEGLRLIAAGSIPEGRIKLDRARILDPDIVRKLEAEAAGRHGEGQGFVVSPI